MAVPVVLGVSLDKVLAEFIGTFVLVFTVGCVVLGPSLGCFGVTAIASSLMVMIYAVGDVSGANLNPAVTVALLSAGKTDPKTAAMYVVSQTVAGIVAAFAYVGLYEGKSFNLAPGDGYTVDEAVAVEFLYTCMLCFVVLCVATTKKNEGNGFFGLAIGFVIVAGGYGAGALSGGAFNPAVAIGIDVSSAKDSGIHFSIWYVCAEFAGAGLAAALHRICYPEEYGGEAEPTITRRCAAEMIGTFFLALTAFLNAKVKATAAAWSIAASLMCMIYALGTVSGAHFNPSVTLAVLASRRKRLSPADAGAYVGAQFMGGMIAAVVFAGIFGFKIQAKDQLSEAPRKVVTLVDALIVEMVFTAVIAFVVLTVATTEKPLKHMYGLAIGMCVTAGGVAASKISGGVLNPAVGFGNDFSSIVSGAALQHPDKLVGFVGMELVGGLFAALAFTALYPEEFKGESALVG